MKEHLINIGNQFKIKPFNLLRNPVSMSGLLLTGVCTLIGLPMMFLDMFAPRTNPYAGIFIYFFLPGGAIFGVFLAMLGVIIERRSRKRHPDRPIPPLPKIDLSKPSHRFLLLGGVASLLIVFLLLSVTGYRAYNFSDSVQFCGLTCHKVMKPEYTAYQKSPHAHVACVSCHIGPGVNWFVRSKITGAYQVYSVLFHKYDRPIATPIRNLVPAHETCEQCHWPAKFFGAQQKVFSHRLADEKNSPWQMVSLLKVGGGDPQLGSTSGIHWHMYIKNKIYFIDTDGKREVIPWVRSVSKDGTVTEYMSTESSLSPEEISKRQIRQVDCIDCHNRPSHIFMTPHRAMDQAFDANLIDPGLPYLTREAMRLLAGEYANEKEALEAINKNLPVFYQANYPDIYKQKKGAIDQAVKTVQNIYSHNMFPEMRTDWRAHPAHIGHLEFDGCFRCHDGLHKSKEGRVITNDCNACHTILAQGSPADVAKGRLQSQAFKHPVDAGMDVSTMKCTVCHTGTTGL